jgi:hypothetical protein
LAARHAGDRGAAGSGEYRTPTDRRDDRDPLPVPARPAPRHRGGALARDPGRAVGPNGEVYAYQPRQFIEFKADYAA